MTFSENIQSETRKKWFDFGGELDHYLGGGLSCLDGGLRFPSVILVITIIKLSGCTSRLESFLFICLLPHTTGHNGRPLWHHSIFFGRAVRSPVLVQNLDSQWDSHPSNMWKPPRWWHHVVVWGASGTSRRADRASFWALQLRRNIELLHAKQSDYVIKCMCQKWMEGGEI